jgi:hypothetical protein
MRESKTNKKSNPDRLAVEKVCSRWTFWSTRQRSNSPDHGETLPDT